MKKYFIPLLSIALFTGSLAATPTNDETPIIIVVKDGNDLGGGPRMPTMAPIHAFVFGNTIYLSFSSNLGEIDVVLYEESEGVVLQTSIDSSDLSAALPFSGVSGEYTITFSLSNGVEYEGAFTISF